MKSASPAEVAAPAAEWPRSTQGEYLLGGQPLSRVVEAVGGTPCYLYDRQRIAARVRDLREALAPGSSCTTRSRRTRCRRW